MSRIDWHLSSKYLCSGLIPLVVNVELHCCFISFICVITIAYVHLNPCMAGVRKSGSKRQHVTISACALSARTYNAEVQGSDARLRNHFVRIYTYCNSEWQKSHSLLTQSQLTSASSRYWPLVNRLNVMNASNLTTVILPQPLTRLRT